MVPALPSAPLSNSSVQVLALPTQESIRALNIGPSARGNTTVLMTVVQMIPSPISSTRASAMSHIESGVATAGKPINTVV